MVHAKIKAPKKEMLIFNDLSHLFLVEDIKKVTPTILKTFVTTHPPPQNLLLMRLYFSSQWL